MERTNIDPKELPEPRGYTHLVVLRDAGKMIYVAPQLGWNKDREFVHGSDLKSQVEGAYRNLGVALAAAGATYRDVVKLTVYVVGLKPDMVPTLRAARLKFFTDEQVPALTQIGVTSLVSPEVLIEIEAIAAVPSPSSGA